MNISKDDFMTVLDTYSLIVEKLEALAVNLSFKGLVDKEIIQRIEGIAYIAMRRKEFLVGRHKDKSTSLTVDRKIYKSVEECIVDLDVLLESIYVMVTWKGMFMEYLDGLAKVGIEK